MIKRVMLFVGVIISFMCIAGCSSKKKEQQELSVYTYSEIDESLRNNYISNIKTYGDDIYFVAEKWPDVPSEFSEEYNELINSENENITELADELYDRYGCIAKAEIWKYNRKSGEKSIVYNKEYYINDGISEYSINDDGLLTIIFSEYNPGADEEDEQYTKSVIQVSADGTELSSQPLEEYAGNAEYKNAHISIDSKGNIYGQVGDNYEVKYIFKMNPERELIGKIDCGDTDIWESVMDSNGNILLKCSSSGGHYEYMTADYEQESLKKLDDFIIDNKKEENDADKSEEGPEYNLIGYAGENNFLIGDNIYMYDYNMENNTLTPILKWLDCGIVGSSVNEAVQIDEERFLCSIIGSDDNEYKAVIFEKNDSEYSQRTTLTLAGLNNNDDIRKEIIKFNRENTQYKIEYKTYDDMADPGYALNLDITAGKVPDIIDVSDVDKDMFISAGVLSDLTPFMEQDDVVNKDYFVDGLLDNTAVDGKQYYLLNGFSIYTIAGKASDVKKYKDNWTMDSFIQYCNSAAGSQVFNCGYKQNVFETMLEENVDSYINWSTGEVYFDGEEFRKFMEFCNSLPDSENVDVVSDDTAGLRSGKLLFTVDWIHDLSGMTYMDKVFKGASYIGYPGKNGGVSHIVPQGGVFAIGELSEHKEAAWDFLKSVIDSGKYDEDSTAFPASKTEFEKMVRRYTATEEYIDEDGKTVKPIHDEWDNFGTVYDIGPAAPEKVDELRDMIKHSKIISFDDTDAEYEIIAEEADRYFSGEKSLDETISVIQDRMTKYVNENR